MGACRIQYVLPVFLLVALHWTLAQSTYCEVSRTLSLEDDPGRTFNWTSKAEKCNPGEFCQETVLLIKAEGTKTVILASKSCVPQGVETVTFVQYTAPPGLVAISYSNYCNDSLCNNKDNLASVWKVPETTATSNMSGTRHCPTCVALGSCSSAPSLPCANGTTQCYQGRLEFSGGGLDSIVHVKGCTTMIGCRLMAKIVSVGPMTVKETCNYQSFLQPRKAEIGASWMPTSLWVLELLLPALLLPLIHFP
ncbi:testis-expressed protein 101 [Grammomys surdaster]|uniref:testis-expressed protein 101 n=1 Tax=Grammomys surdaster TaxID=491861 RepID=UPI00109FB15A|nr:testis-expressed protein 101 [Grammomys surdaster]XP_028638403.1 testis-expressed protein 101 [Grammomys surdaster]XP_028638404.1 testis-expressed protein 101 [Grammomys surdaster]